MAPSPSLAAVLIVRDEEDTLSRCLASLSGLVDQVVVYDTGSADGTTSVARAAGATVIDGFWDRDFAAARNRAMEHVHTEWALALDADEEVIGDASALRALLSASPYDVFLVRIENSYPESLGGSYEHPAQRLFRTAAARYQGRVHEQLAPSAAQDLAISRVEGGALRIRHHGYADEAAVQAKGARNALLAKAELDSLVQVGCADGGRVATTLLALGRSFVAAGERQNAVDTLEMLRDSAPGTPEAAQAGDFLARLLLADGQDEAVLVVVEELRRAEVGSQYCDWLAAQALAHLGRVDEARTLIEGVTLIEDAGGRIYNPASILTMRDLIRRLPQQDARLSPQEQRVRATALHDEPSTQPSVGLIVATFRRGDPNDPHLWDDLRVALTSIEAYAPDLDVLVAWDGPRPPDRMPENSRIVLARRPPDLDISAAFNWCARQMTTGLLVMMSDDAVLHPDTLRLMTEDWHTLTTELGLPVGLLGTRCNIVAGAANVRQPNGGIMAGFGFDSEEQILPVATVFPVVAMFDRHAYLDVGGFTEGLTWYADNLLCWDLANRGYRHFVSRAYVHHIGQRGSTSDSGRSMAQQSDLSLAWLTRNRPDFYAALSQA